MNVLNNNNNNFIERYASGTQGNLTYAELGQRRND